MSGQGEFLRWFIAHFPLSLKSYVNYVTTPKHNDFDYVRYEIGTRSYVEQVGNMIR
jgi:hypothetical protein